MKTATRPVETFESRWTEVNGLNIHARVSLSGHPPVVLVHGVGMSSRYLMPTAGWLARDFDVYVPDLPGFGHSDKPERTLRLTELTDWLVAWMDVVGLAQLAMLGNSFGCQLIVDLAVRYPERISRAVLQGPTMDPYWRTWPQQIVCWLQNAMRSPPSLGPISLRDYTDCGPKRFFETFQDAMDDKVEDKLPHVRCPAMVVRGTKDPFTSQTWVEQATQLLPHGCLRNLPGAGHPANIDSPLQLYRVVRPFLLAGMQAEGVQTEEPDERRKGEPALVLCREAAPSNSKAERYPSDTR
jgi:2-hydroxy-6-oxonona-2,4-dienedioate hydrolase